MLTFALAVGVSTGCVADRSSSNAGLPDATTPRPDGSTADASTPSPDGGSTPPTVLPARDTARVYWVGHSLTDHRDVRNNFESFYARMLVELVGFFAEDNGQTYTQYRHTTPGAPLWWNWLREEELTRNLLSTAQDYDTIVITESIPIWVTYTSFNTSFYARQFACAALRGNPATTVYIYETWPHFQAGDPDLDYPEQELWDFRAQLTEDRRMYDAVTTEIRSPNLRRPDDYSFTYEGTDPAEGCSIDRDVYIIPGGTALAALWDRLAEPNANETWEGLTMAKVFQNGWVNWPENWPVTPQEARSIDGRAITAALPVDDPSIDIDDIHMSYIGSYYIGLVAYATIYRQNPVGLPTVDRLSPTLARKLQELAWEVVINDPKTGVRAP
ncbi:MAG: hypothetical protein AAFV29_03920 [Myxococcota bacterium]